MPKAPAKSKLNLGCGNDIRPGWLNLDLLELPGVDMVWDLNRFPYPFEEDTFDSIFSSHVLEHLEDLINVMAELRRITRPGGTIRLELPHFSCGVSHRDPTHKRLFSYFTFEYFHADCFYGLPPFETIERSLNFTRFAQPWLNKIFNPLINLSPSLYERFFCWMLPCAECRFILKVPEKPERSKLL